jgi:hypothetical protein
VLRHDNLPQLSVDLIAQLDETFPLKCINPGESLDSAHRYAGKRDVVEFLKSLVRASAETKPTDKLLR